MIKVLFICHGNICRSVAAEMVMRQMIDQAPQGSLPEISVESMAATREEIGNDIYPPMKRALSARGYACGPHGARQATRADCERADLILCADRANVSNMKRIAGQAAGDKISLLLSWARRNEEVADPWSTRDFDAALDDIEEGCAALLKALLAE